MSIFSKIATFGFALSLPLTTVFAADAPNLIAKHHHEHEDEGKIYVAVQSFSDVSGTFNFRLIIQTPSGEQFSSTEFNSAALPTPPFQLTAFDPLQKGTYLIYYIVDSITTPGSLALSLQEVATVAGAPVNFIEGSISGTSDRLGQQVFLGLFTSPQMTESCVE